MLLSSSTSGDNIDEESLERLSIHYPFNRLSRDARELYLETTSISRISVPTPLEFYRDYVSKNKPVIITNALNDWPALSKWSNSYLREQLHDTRVTIDITPDGLGDAVKKHKYFVTPLEEKMKFNDFMDIIEGKDDRKEIVYCQHQNSSFMTEFEKLHGDISELKWVKEAFGQQSPDAVNIWIGTAKSVSSLHHDPYENLYGVIQGRKYFTLYPPTDLYWLNQQMFKKAHYERLTTEQRIIDDNGMDLRDGSQFVIVPDTDQSLVPWFDHELDIDTDYLNPLNVVVEKGELLYLPSLWFHRVSQITTTIAVNFWYDMQYDLKWNYYQFMNEIIKQRRQNSPLE
ncbi:unnamed protein product [Didymodactylos carnosus]|uniref:JmjC domain-containing protein n=1 Tax=Didymodactylos carnosus TaxID=1234261 RepID=A0A814GXU8_9BILA|nr:unnamed protein product [Didymodactylos carnosus]CAF1002418.1 unnamed protein product [Didymodactylos carnosus]CAF3645975.1 unnamed protein product [Didymodactylos carnosus]CAF3773829.1 unnamed protein product [Didymodactylos carnosus]